MDLPTSVQKSEERSQPDMPRPSVDLTPSSTTESDHASIVESLLEDPLLNDLTPQVTLEEVKTLIAIEEGRAYRIRIERQRMDAIPLVVSQATTVRQMKKLIQAAFKRMVREQSSTRFVNWKYIWRTHCLVLNGNKLLDDSVAISSIGIKNNSSLSFEKYIARRENRRRNSRVIR
ncbi:hypothetical protein INT43_002659 [Umbelopsis isabellina]|uniref:SNRNP25 ubiquitin-like domain-containing protein n=1 Tax=Mortierella isabellina TaxID=91625 RepID=A0A8H7Q5K4_MORIS|nr:hypothetical protein INT43_002659 [Umbelopsis isabellina]